MHQGDLVVHMYPNGSMQSLTTASAADGSVPITPTVSADRARAVAIARFPGTVTTASTPKLAASSSTT